MPKPYHTPRSERDEIEAALAEVEGVEDFEDEEALLAELDLSDPDDAELAAELSRERRARAFPAEEWLDETSDWDGPEMGPGFTVTWG